MTHPIRRAPIGVLPNQAICCSAMTRPCIAGSVACCSTTVSTVWNAADANPNGMLSATNAQYPGASASATRAAANPDQHETEGAVRVGFDACDVDAAEQRPDCADAHRSADRSGTQLELESNHRWERRLEVQRHGADDDHDEQGSPDVGLVADVGEAFAQFALRPTEARTVDQFTSTDAQQGTDHDEVRRCVDGKADPDVEYRDECSGQGRVRRDATSS